MKANAIMVDAKDNVATVVEPISKGADIHYFVKGELVDLKASEDIPANHKIALAGIKTGEHVIKYGETIGAATRDIPVGAWVSHENIVSLPRDYDSELK
ncbi:MAG: UxaA family hydrolase [Methylobacteriaceae bacterium]|nr:UxaA family hydrolase [Methylobacteriaceae bacterium]